METIKIVNIKWLERNQKNDKLLANRSVIWTNQFFEEQAWFLRTESRAESEIAMESCASDSGAIDLAKLFAEGKQQEEMLRGVLKFGMERLGPYDPDTLAIMGSLGMLLVQQGKWQEAEELQIGLVECMQLRPLSSMK